MKRFPPDRFEDAISYLVNQVLHALRQGVAGACEAVGYKITPEAVAVLFVLSRENGVSQSRIADILAKDRAVVTRLLSMLVEEGWVERIPDAQDRRVIRAHLTKSGEQALSQMLPAVSNFMQFKVLRDVSDEEFDVACRVLRKMLSNISK